MIDLMEEQQKSIITNKRCRWYHKFCSDDFCFNATSKFELSLFSFIVSASA